MHLTRSYLITKHLAPTCTTYRQSQCEQMPRRHLIEDNLFNNQAPQQHALNAKKTEEQIYNFLFI